MNALARYACARTTVAIAIIVVSYSNAAQARNYLFENISDLAGGPGSGRSAEVNDSGDVAFVDENSVWFYDRSEGLLQNVTALAGAPANPFFIKLNNNGDIAIVETPSSTRDLWLFKRNTQTFTNISALPNYPGDSFSSFPLTTFDLNDSNKISFHSGDNNFGSIYVYDYATGNFDWINGKPGAATFGRENEIKNLVKSCTWAFRPTICMIHRRTQPPTSILSPAVLGRRSRTWTSTTMATSR